MRKKGNKLENANVVAGFDTQDEADEAVLGLRIAGIPDRRVGYFFHTSDGRMKDILAQYHRFAASVIGAIVGAVAGGWFGRFLAGWGYQIGQSPDPLGLVSTCAVCGALFLGTAGGMLGLWPARPGASVPDPGISTDPFVIAVDAEDARDQAQAIMVQHGGHNLRPHVS